jgi:hypothetical protein
MPEVTGPGTTAQGAGTTAATTQSTTSQGDGGGSSRASTTADRREGSRSLVDRLVAKYGSEARALDVLADENWEYRERDRGRTDEIAALKLNQIPTGGVVLTGPEKEAWDKIKACGVPVDKVADTAKLAATLTTEKETAARTKARADVAADAQLDPLVLDPLLTQFELDVESRAEKVVGKDNKIVDGKVAYVRKATDKNATWEKLAEFIARDGSPLKPFALALKAKGIAGTNGTNNGTTSTDSHGVTTHVVPDQTGTTQTGTTSDDPVTQRLAARQKADAGRVNPLLPPKPAATT